MLREHAPGPGRAFSHVHQALISHVVSFAKSTAVYSPLPYLTNQSDEWRVTYRVPNGIQILVAGLLAINLTKTKWPIWRQMRPLAQYYWDGLKSNSWPEGFAVSQPEQCLFKITLYSIPILITQPSVQEQVTNQSRLVTGP